LPQLLCPWARAVGTATAECVLVLEVGRGATVARRGCGLGGWWERWADGSKWVVCGGEEGEGVLEGCQPESGEGCGYCGRGEGVT